MDCGFNINHVLPDDITVVDADAQYWKNTGIGGGRDYMRQQIGSVIDRIGEASAQSQGLLSAITNASKLRSSDHRLYILKDASANSFRGGIIGYMKVAKKKLLLHDPVKISKKEYEPLCILDFFVDVQYQRQGYGTKILNYVLHRERAQAQDLAIDRPTPKLLSFLRAKFNLTDVVKQPSHFVVFADFFNNNSGKVVEPSAYNGLANKGPGEKAKNGFHRKSLEDDDYDDESEVPPEANGMNGHANGNGKTNGHVNGGANGHATEEPYGLRAPFHRDSIDMENKPAVVAKKQAIGKPTAVAVKDGGQWEASVGGHKRQTNGRNLHYQHTQLW